jgi:diaminopropionate ammonia-lyase
MLSCGEASAPALAILRARAAVVVTVSESELADSPRVLRECGGPRTTPSGAAGLAGALRSVGDPPAAAGLGASANSRVLILVTEGALDDLGA